MGSGSEDNETTRSPRAGLKYKIVVEKPGDAGVVEPNRTNPSVKNPSVAIHSGGASSSEDARLGKIERVLEILVQQNADWAR